MRWQWVLKPWALLNSSFRHVLMLDADSFPVTNPEFLFETPQYRDTGAIFWPDVRPYGKGASHLGGDEYTFQG